MLQENGVTKDILPESTKTEVERYYIAGTTIDTGCIKAAELETQDGSSISLVAVMDDEGNLNVLVMINGLK